MDRRPPINQKIRACLSAMERSIDSARNRRLGDVPTPVAAPVSMPSHAPAPPVPSRQNTFIGGSSSMHTPNSVSSAPSSPGTPSASTSSADGPVRLKAKAKRIDPSGTDRHLPRQAG